MAKCAKCEGWGFERDPASRDGWARDASQNAIPCRGCKDHSGVVPEPSAPPGDKPADPATLPEMRG